MRSLSGIGLPVHVGPREQTRHANPEDETLYGRRTGDASACRTTGAVAIGHRNAQLQAMVARARAAAELAPHALSLVPWRCAPSPVIRFIWNATKLTPPETLAIDPAAPHVRWKRCDGDSIFAPFYVPDVGEIVLLLDDGPSAVLQRTDYPLACLFARRRQTRDRDLQVLARRPAGIPTGVYADPSRTAFAQ